MVCFDYKARAGVVLDMDHSMQYLLDDDTIMIVQSNFRVSIMNLDTEKHNCQLHLFEFNKEFSETKLPRGFISFHSDKLGKYL